MDYTGRRSHRKRRGTLSRAASVELLCVIFHFKLLVKSLDVEAVDYALFTSLEMESTEIRACKKTVGGISQFNRQWEEQICVSTLEILLQCQCSGSCFDDADTTDHSVNYHV